MPERAEEYRKEKCRRRTDGGDSQFVGSNTGSTEETGSGYGFSVESSNSWRLETQGMGVNDYVNILNNDSINISNHLNVHNFDKFNLEVIGSLRPQGEVGQEMKEWEKAVLMSLNNMDHVERDDCKNSYVKYKLFKRDISCEQALAW